jgi:lipase
VILPTRRWGFRQAEPVVCLHGATQHAGVFEDLGKQLAAAGRFVVAPDLRGHGESGREPPWDTETHVDDVLATLDDLGIERAAWVGHSYGGVVAATAAARAPDRVERLALLDPGLEVPPEHALGAAEIDRLDWSFTNADGAVNALLSSPGVVAAPRETVAAYVEDDLERGADGLLRFSFCRSTVVTLWSEMSRPAPPVAQVPTLLIRPVASYLDGRAQDRRYRQSLNSLLTIVAVPNGHNVLWESPVETAAALERFLQP